MEESPRNVLLIEDNPGDVRLIKEMLAEKRYGTFNMAQAVRLSSGLEMLEKEPFDIVLLDLSLPDSQGIETFDRIKEKVGRLPVVILTGQNNELMGINAVRAGAQDYLVKGEVDSNLLSRTLSYAIERKRSECLLLEYQEKLRSLASQVSLAEERERRRIATEVHDNLSQNLAFCTMRLSLLLKKALDPELTASLQEIYDSLQEQATTTRSLTFELSPPELYDFGLEVAMRGLCERMSKKHHIPIFFEDDGKRKNVERDIRVELFRMVRELLVNAIKHASAESLIVKISRNGPQVQITVQDDGVGFDPVILEGNHGGGFGLFSIRERLQYMGGNIEISSHKGDGSRFTIAAPLKMEREPRKAVKSKV